MMHRMSGYTQLVEKNNDHQNLSKTIMRYRSVYNKIALDVLKYQ